MSDNVQDKSYVRLAFGESDRKLITETRGDLIEGWSIREKSEELTLILTKDWDFVENKMRWHLTVTATSSGINRWPTPTECDLALVLSNITTPILKGRTENCEHFYSDVTRGLSMSELMSIGALLLSAILGWFIGYFYGRNWV